MFSTSKTLVSYLLKALAKVFSGFKVQCSMEYRKNAIPTPMDINSKITESHIPGEIAHSIYEGWRAVQVSW